jgi:hypothetical protein
MHITHAYTHAQGKEECDVIQKASVSKCAANSVRHVLLFGEYLCVGTRRIKPNGFYYIEVDVTRRLSSTFY